ncbi:MAG: hypothetical protein A2144_14120 [Chloroflexi bacterium RBG_16_50_9]|nr:MAG: hypothetical protein A2144_14120 [Chloroflexi bacterium RBG_16_50_9]
MFQMEQKHFWHIGRREIIWEALKSIPDIHKARILEIGCGNGSVLAFLHQRGLNVEGGDIFLEGLQFCRKRDVSVPLYRIDILELPFTANFDVIGLFDILEHITEDEKALREAHRALKPEGKILITVPAHAFLWRQADRVAAHKRRYSRAEIITKLQQNGFTIKKLSYYISFFLPLFIAMKLVDSIFKKRHPGGIKSILEFRTIPVINEVCLWLLRFENRVVKRCSLPFGASMLILAEKK